MYLFLAGLCVWGPANISWAPQTGQTCLPASAAMVMSSFGQRIKPQRLAKELPMYLDGTSFFSVQNELERRGLETLVFQGGRSELRSALKAGLSVIIALVESNSRHAVVVSRLTGCSAAKERFVVLDPRQKGERLWLPDALARQLSAGQMLLAYQKRDRASLQRSKFPLERAMGENRRYRASSWIRRARKHTTINPEQLELLRRAHQADPCWLVAQERYSQTAKALKVSPKNYAIGCGSVAPRR